MAPPSLGAVVAMSPPSLAAGVSLRRWPAEPVASANHCRAWSFRPPAAWGACSTEAPKSSVFSLTAVPRSLAVWPTASVASRALAWACSSQVRAWALRCSARASICACRACSSASRSRRLRSSSSSRWRDWARSYSVWSPGSSAAPLAATLPATPRKKSRATAASS